VDYATCYVILCENKVVHFTTEHFYVVNSNDSTLHYSAHAVAESGALSSLSNTVTIGTISNPSKNRVIENDLGVKFYAHSGMLYLTQIPKDAIVEVFTVSGQPIFSKRAKGSEITIPAKGVCIVSIRTPKGEQTFKVWVG
jgi:nitrogenase subunit NifH